MTEKMAPRKQKRPMVCLVQFLLMALLVAVVLGPFIVHRPRPMPPGTRLNRPVAVAADAVQLLIDTTGVKAESGQRVVQQEIFDAVLQQIASARSCILLDFFLWNGWQGRVREDHRALSHELADALIARKTSNPALDILVLTDPINRVYGADEEPFYQQMVAAGIPVIFTDVSRLRDSNPIYSVPARFYGEWLTRWPWLTREFGFRRFAHPFAPGQQTVSLAQMARMLNFKANHRKLVVTDQEDGTWHALVCSLNPADGSSAHSNIGLRLSGEMAACMAREELTAIEWSAANPACVLESRAGEWRETAVRMGAVLDVSGDTPIQGENLPISEWLTEGAIRDRVLTMLNDAGQGDEIRIAMFYLSERTIVRALKDAAFGGARVRLILDLNRDAFGRVKNGIPNRPVAYELMAFAAQHDLDVTVRWAVTHGEQFHTKAMCITHPGERPPEFICGSANWTRRNLGDLNMEGCVYLAGANGVAARFNVHFDTLWNNADQMEYTAGYERFAETGWSLRGKTLLYRVQEATGVCTF